MTREVPFVQVPVGASLWLRYETARHGVKTSEDTVEFDGGGCMSLIKPDTVRAFIPAAPIDNIDV